MIFREYLLILESFFYGQKLNILLAIDKKHSKNYQNAMKKNLKRIVLVSCGSKKLKHPSRAQDIYIGPLFRHSLKYAQSLNPDHIFILSAKHGLLSLDQEIEPYEQTLNKMPPSYIQLWADQVINQLQGICSIDKSEFIFLAGERYRKYLLPKIKNARTPLSGLTIGKQLQRLKSLCHE